MKHIWFSYFFTMILIAIFIALCFWLFSPIVKGVLTPTLSPLPDFLTMMKNKQVATQTLFLPTIDKDNPQFGLPQIHAKTFLSYDLTTNKVLLERNPKEKHPMASLTKIMTAIIGYENKLSSDRYIVTKEALVGEDSMGLTEGETLTFNELLYGLMLQSGNDAAEVIARNYPYGRNSFVVAMNDKAKALGLKDTNFTNPTGLQGDGDQHTTVYDLLVVTKYAMENVPGLAQTVATYEHHIPENDLHKQFDLYNETNLLTTYPGVKGIKTGYTPEAGLCLATYLDYQGHQIIAILLGSDDRKTDMKYILDLSLKNIGIEPPKHI